MKFSLPNRPITVAFYAYSPIAGGFLAKTPEQLKDGKGRWNLEGFIGQLYKHLYVDRPKMIAALATWNEIAKSEGVPAAELAFRWVFHNSILDGSKGDTVVVGASSLAQLRQTVAAVRRGPVSAAAQEKIQAVWESVKQDALLGNINTISDEFKMKLGDAVKNQ